LEAKIIDKDYTSDFQSQAGDATIIENIKAINPDIVSIENKLFGHFTSIKKKYLQHKRKSKQLQRLLEESENQLQSVGYTLIKSHL